MNIRWLFAMFLNKRRTTTMNPRTPSTLIFSVITLGTLFFQTGCATTGNQRASSTRSTMKDVEQDYMDALAQVDVTDGSLQTLIDEGQPDEKKAYEKYSNNVGKMNNLGHRLSDRANKMSAEQKNYFEEWRMQGNTYTDEKIQALSEQRRADLAEVFAKISQASVGVNGSLRAYISDIGQIKTYLSSDLTPKGVEALTPTIQKAITDGGNLKDAVQPVLVAIGNARAELAQGGN
jgi:hypothetical protein